MIYRYYSTQRPIMPGCFPKPNNNKVVEIFNFDDRTMVESIGRPAWGFVSYAFPLSQSDISSYELVPEK